MSDSVPVPADLPATEALRLADRARAAARRPAPTPGWYGPALAAGFIVYGAVVGLVIAAHLIWLLGVLSAVWSAFCVLVARAGMRGSGIMQKGLVPGTGGPVLLGVIGVVAAGLAGAALTWLAGGGPQVICTIAGAAMGAAFWLLNAGLNRRIRRLRAAG